MLIIYRVFNRESNKSYIGKCSNGLNRVNDHFKDYSNDNLEYRAKLLYRAMKKHGEDIFSYEILYTANTEDELNVKEKEFIIKFDSRNTEKGYNIAEGGTGGNMWEGISIEEREIRIKKQVEGQKDMYTEEWRRDASIRMKKTRSDPEKSKKNAEITSKRLKLMNVISPARRLKVKCMENDIIYNSYKEAAEALNIHYTSISKSVRFNKKVKGFTFKKVK